VREELLLQSLLSACEEQNADMFSEAVAEYDKISRLDQWHTTLLLRVKKTIEGDMDLR
jgi:alpha-soluble NSF attachment protein